MLYNIIVLGSSIMFFVTYDHVTVTCNRCITVCDIILSLTLSLKNKIKWENKMGINKVQL